MTIKRKASKEPILIQTDIEDMIGKVISRGGKTAVGDEPDPTAQELPKEEEEIRFTLRIASGLIKQIDSARKLRVGNVSRNQWIIEAINSAVK